MKRFGLTVGLLLAAISVAVSPLLIPGKVSADGQAAGYCVSGAGATNGLGSCRGYFTGNTLNTYDNAGNGHVYSLIGGGMNYNDAASFKSAIDGYVNQSISNGISSDQLGASFLVEQMMGNYGPVGGATPRKTGVLNARADLAAWKNLVDEYDGSTPGYWIDWSRPTTVDVNSAYFGLGDDDGFHTDTNDHINAIAFMYPGGMFRIQRSCGNLVGDAAPPTPPKWGKMTATSVAKDSKGVDITNGSIAAGRTIYWTHTVNDDGTVGPLTTPTISGGIRKWDTTGSDTWNNQPYSQTFTVNNPLTRSDNRTTTNPGDIGTKFCELITGDQTSSTDGTSFASGSACVLVVTPPKITPHTQITPNPVGIGQGYTATAWYTNGGGIAGDATGTWQTWLDNGDQTYGAGDSNVSGPTPSTNTVSTSGTTPFGLTGTTAGTADGTHAYVCTELRITSVGGGGTTAPGSENPPPAGSLSADKTCAPIVSRPYFSVVGGDVAAGPGFGTTGVAGAQIIGTNNDGSPNYNGASAQLAALALGNIKSFATALSQSKIDMTGNPQQFWWIQSLGGGYTPSALGFANNPLTAGTYGGTFNQSGWKIQDYYSTTSATTAFPGTVNAPTGSYSSTGLTLGGGSITADGRKIVLKVNGNVYINGNITYSSAGGTVTNIPQFELIVSGNIYVDPGVTELDGFYAVQGNGTTTGRFVSCASNAGPTYSVGACNTPTLVVNGAVAAQKVILNRTSGDINGSGLQRPGETIRFSPLLWIPSATGGSGVAGWQSVTSLPPIL